jgi:hypothetical protein
MRSLELRATVFPAALILVAVACAQQTTAVLDPPATRVAAATAVLDSPAVAAATAVAEPTVKTTQLTPEGSPPKVDTSIASVSLDDIVFDTFRGGYIALSNASDATIERLRDVIKPIYEPRYDTAAGGDWLNDDDIVLAFPSASGAFAYPVKMLNLHEIVNDVIDGVPVLVSYCPLCASGVVYSRELDGETLLFGNTSALFESDMVMYDHQTGSYWFQVLGEAIVGSLTGKRLEMLPSVMVTWGQWKRQHPDTRVLSRNLGLLTGGPGNPYDRDPFVGYQQRVNQGAFIFPVTEEKLDGRLSPGEMVFAVQVGESHKAYPLSGESDRVVNDEVGGKRIVVIVRAAGPGAVAYMSQVGSREFAFRLSDGSVEDIETMSLWDDTGLAVSGPMAGAQLIQVPSRTSFWFSLVGALPGIELHSSQ